MKRWCIRLSVLSVVVALGCIAIAESRKTNADSPLESVAADDAVPRPIQAEPPRRSRNESNQRNISNANHPVVDQAKAFNEAAAQQSQKSDNGNLAARENTIPPANSSTANASQSSQSPRRDPFGLGSPATRSSGVDSQGPSDKRYQNFPAPTGDRYTKAANQDPIAEPAALPERARTAQPLQGVADDSARYRTQPSSAVQNGAPQEREFNQPNSNHPAGRVRQPADAQFAEALPVARGGFAERRVKPGTVNPTGRPGGRHLEGPQGPQVILEKIVPEEIQVGKPSTFDIKVVNSGTVTAYDVQVQDVVPEGTRLLGTKPESQSDAGGTLRWSLGNLEPGAEKYVEVKLMPDSEGEIGSVASVTYATRASGRTLATKPELKIDASSAGQVMIGDQVAVTITISNLGSGVARDIILFDSLPAEVRHPAGTDLEFAVGELAPKETRKIELTMTAARAGVVKNLLSARGDGNLVAETIVEFEVIAPQLAVSIKGPRRRYLERRATYTVQVANPGTATAENIELISRLPRALKFVSANNSGRYDENTHAVYWSLEELPGGEQGKVKLVALPTESGAHTLRVESTAQGNLSDSSEETVQVEGLSALFFEVVDVEDPVEVGGETAYEIRVLNQGTKLARNIVVTAMLPQDLKPLSTDGPTHGTIQGNQVVFEPLPRLAPKGDTTYTVHAQGVRPGDQRVRVQVQSDDLKSPVTKEESTRVYADR